MFSTHTQLTPLNLAILKQDVKKALELINESTADINTPRAYGWTPLHLAAKHGLTDVVKALLANDADTTAKTARGLIPADVASNAIIRDLIDAETEKKSLAPTRVVVSELGVGEKRLTLLSV